MERKIRTLPLYIYVSTLPVIMGVVVHQQCWLVVYFRTLTLGYFVLYKNECKSMILIFTADRWLEYPKIVIYFVNKILRKFD